VTQDRALSRDYKDVTRPTPGGPALRDWVGLLVGLAIGLAVALGVFLHDRNGTSAQRCASGTKPSTTGQATEDAAPAPADRYTFPDILPSQEVAVPAPAENAGGQAPELRAGTVVLEAGSFKRTVEAEKVQARLAQYGVVAKIRPFAREGETWYRVRIGPIASVEELEAIQAKLSEAEVVATRVTPTVKRPPP
jgi:cell division protein FtsN